MIKYSSRLFLALSLLAISTLSHATEDPFAQAKKDYFKKMFAETTPEQIAHRVAKTNKTILQTEYIANGCQIIENSNIPLELQNQKKDITIMYEACKEHHMQECTKITDENAKKECLTVAQKFCDIYKEECERLHRIDTTLYEHRLRTCAMIKREFSDLKQKEIEAKINSLQKTEQKTEPENTTSQENNQ